MVFSYCRWERRAKRGTSGGCAAGPCPGPGARSGGAMGEVGGGSARGDRSGRPAPIPAGEGDSSTAGVSPAAIWPTHAVQSGDSAATKARDRALLTKAAPYESSIHES